MANIYTDVIAATGTWQLNLGSALVFGLIQLNSSTFENSPNLRGLSRWFFFSFFFPSPLIEKWLPKPRAIMDTQCLDKLTSKHMTRSRHGQEPTMLRQNYGCIIGHNTYNIVSIQIASIQISWRVLGLWLWRSIHDLGIGRCNVGRSKPHIVTWWGFKETPLTFIPVSLRCVLIYALRPDMEGSTPRIRGNI